MALATYCAEMMVWAIAFPAVLMLRSGSWGSSGLLEAGPVDMLALMVYICSSSWDIYLS